MVNNETTGVTPDKLKADLISRIKSIEELFSSLDNIAPIKGSQQVYSAEDLMESISGVHSGTLDITAITSTCGLRQKVSELLDLDKTKQAERKPLNKFTDLAGKNLTEFYAPRSSKSQFILSQLGFPSLKGDRVDDYSKEQLINFLQRIPTKRDFFVLLNEKLNKRLDTLKAELDEVTSSISDSDKEMDKLDKKFKVQRYEESIKRITDILFASAPDSFDELTMLLYGEPSIS